MAGRPRPRQSRHEQAIPGMTLAVCSCVCLHMSSTTVIYNK